MLSRFHSFTVSSSMKWRARVRLIASYSWNRTADQPSCEVEQGSDGSDGSHCGAAVAATVVAIAAAGAGFRARACACHHFIIVATNWSCTVAAWGLQSQAGRGCWRGAVQVARGADAVWWVHVLGRARLVHVGPRLLDDAVNAPCSTLGEGEGGSGPGQRKGVYVNTLQHTATH